MLDNGFRYSQIFALPQIIRCFDYTLAIIGKHHFLLTIQRTDISPNVHFVRLGHTNMEVKTRSYRAKCRISDLTFPSSPSPDACLHFHTDNQGPKDSKFSVLTFPDTKPTTPPGQSHAKL